MYHIVYVAPEPAPPTDGPHLASSMGYHDFGTAVEQRNGAHPELAHLVENGWSDRLDALAAELPAFATAVRGTAPDAAHVADLFAAALRDAPAGTTAVLVTDGEPGADEPLEGAPPESNVY